SADSKGKRYPSPRLNFSTSDGEPRGMPLFCLLYPSQFLADCFVPIEALNEGLPLSEIEAKIKKTIADHLVQLNIEEDQNAISRTDERWYYLALFLLDSIEYREEWLARGGSLADFDDIEGDAVQSTHKARQNGFIAHIKALEDLLKGSNHKLGRKPDDLLDVLATIALASPSICILRTYKNFAGADTNVPTEYPSQLAKIFINRMNTPESTSLIEAVSGNHNPQPHWRKLLTYCKNGNLQAVFDEYVHVIVESNNLNRNEKRMELLHGIIRDSMNIHTASYRIDTYNGFRDRIRDQKKNNELQIRSHFAVAFTNSDGGLDKGQDRKKSVRNSFNSPFRPFVLATTSIGQEGLDFHYYCRKIVHWNLPSNPIDLEQREGRINRFKSLAIRQNIALRYGNQKFSKTIWPEMFEAALENEKLDKGSELVPFWGLNHSEDMIKIERIVPMYPFSRDIAQYHRLIKILSLYRLTLGQARQEELLEYLYTNHTEEDLQKLFINLSPFYKKL
ncbi:MAG TPA: helicase, partial [Rikenellaceae bacterium]|nr:helicase [Rikenellaceae bacterium]